MKRTSKLVTAIASIALCYSFYQVLSAELTNTLVFDIGFRPATRSHTMILLLLDLPIMLLAGFGATMLLRQHPLPLAGISTFLCVVTFLICAPEAITIPSMWLHWVLLFVACSTGAFLSTLLIKKMDLDAEPVAPWKALLVLGVSVCVLWLFSTWNTDRIAAGIIRSLAPETPEG